MVAVGVITLLLALPPVSRAQPNEPGIGSSEAPLAADLTGRTGTQPDSGQGAASPSDQDGGTSGADGPGTGSGDPGPSGESPPSGPAGPSSPSPSNPESPGTPPGAPTTEDPGAPSPAPPSEPPGDAQPPGSPDDASPDPDSASPGFPDPITGPPTAGPWPGGQQPTPWPGEGGVTLSPYGSELAAAWAEVALAERDLAHLRSAVRNVAVQLALLDERLADAGAALAAVTAELEEAEQRLSAATTAEREATAYLQEINTQLEQSVDAYQDHRNRLESRAISTFKYGAAATSDVIIRGITGASDLHDLAVSFETVSRILDDDRSLVTDAAELTRDTAELEAEVARARNEAMAAARNAEVERQVVEQIVARQQALLAGIETERTERATVLAALEADVEAREVLVRELEAVAVDLEFSSGQWFVPVVVNVDLYGPPPAWASLLPPAGHAWAAPIDAVAARHGIDGRLMAALVWSESNFNPSVVSHAGAIGLAQLMPGTARGLGVDPRDPIANLDGGTRYLRAQLERFGRLDLALAAYNAGPNRVAAVGRVPNIVETQIYVVRVMERYQMLSGL